MSDIVKYSKYPLAINKLELTKYLFAEIPNDYDAIELVISIHDANLNINELSSYLDFIYRIDGHLSEIGYNKYVHNPRIQIEIDRIRIGSWEIIIERLLNSVGADKLIILYLALKFLPNVVQTIGDSFQKYYQIMSSREDYLEKRDKRKTRKEIREFVNQEDWFSSLDKKYKEKIVVLLDDLFREANKKVIPASRFAKKSIKNIYINPTKKKSNT